MPNPILQLLSGNNQNNQNNLVNRLNSIKQFMTGKNSNLIYQQLLQSNPQFRKFVQDAEGKSLEDLAMEYDIDLNLLKKFL